ncbi:TorF family putative porin [Methylomonas sp. HW2-6]|uniref:TorF family putative porin n=1 Tax=Methylomonas sp. HW2-6 TaxID=3376687 RepID=UPI004042E1C2
MDRHKHCREGWFLPGLVILAIAIVGVLHGSVARAEWHGELVFLSDYLYRGYSKNRSNPLAQGRIDYQDTSGWFAGLGISQVSFDDRRYKNYADVEIKPYIGWSLPLNANWRAEMMAAGYIFDGKIFGKYADYAELYALLHYQDWFTGSVSVAPNAYQRDATVMNYEIKYRRDILDNLQLSLGLGYFQADALLEADYFYWNAGVSWYLTPNLALDMRYVDVNLDHQKEVDYHHHEFYPRLLENKFLFSLTLGF